MDVAAMFHLERFQFNWAHWVWRRQEVYDILALQFPLCRVRISARFLTMTSAKERQIN